ncbi:MAG: hypothetical protein JXB07_14410 [Anaerolineae bacterium]|nr:hypothetical protein [Anaerolineae bacterium]
MFPIEMKHIGKIDAVWANLIGRRALDLTDLSGRPHRLRIGSYPGLDGKEGTGGKPAPTGFPLNRFNIRIEHLAIDHCILFDNSRRFSQESRILLINSTQFVFMISIINTQEGMSRSCKTHYHARRS